MARKRTISPELWTDEKVLELPWQVVGFYIGTISQADDEGRLKWSGAQLHARIVGGRADITPVMIRSWMTALVKAGLIVTYKIGETEYAYHPAWASHQYVNRPQKSSIPQPPVPSRERTGAAPITDNSVNDPESVSSQQVPSLSVSLSESLSESESVARETRADRRKKAKPLPELPPETADDVDRLAANEPGGSRVIEEALLTLRRALEKRGLDALLYGIDVAIGKGKGIRYAAACARDWTESDRVRSPNVAYLPTRRIKSRGWVYGVPWEGFRDTEPIGYSSVPPEPDYSAERHA